MIPKIIHYCWFGRNEMPESARKCIESWKKYCPDYKIIEWNEDNYDVHKNRYMSDAYKNKKWGFVPDYARLDIIHEYGGIYMDTDVELIKPIDDLLKYDSYAGLEEPGTVAFGLGFGAEKGNHLVKEMMNSYENLSFYNGDGSLNLVPSPVYQTRVLKHHGLSDVNENQIVEGMHIFATDYFCPIEFSTNIMHITSNTRSIHYFTASWYTPKQAALRKLKINMQKRKIPGGIQKIVTFPYRIGIVIDNVGILGGIRLLNNKLKKRQ